MFGVKYSPILFLKLVLVNLKILFFFVFLLSSEFSPAQYIYGTWELDPEQENPPLFGDLPCGIIRLELHGKIMFAWFHDATGFACPTYGRYEMKKQKITGDVIKTCVVTNPPETFSFAFKYDRETDTLVVLFKSGRYNFHRFKSGD